jgi:hypothetical protein
MRKRPTVALAALAAGMTILVGGLRRPARATTTGFKTSEPSMLTPLAQDSSVTPIADRG